ncbi:MAG TPA: carboxypeptidase regulatory-like domain-containing protein [Edaphobacter sp.]|nr:carboxypeptidase regulatory-like domain-containing protein [Edaphobacter sp.]
MRKFTNFVLLVLVAIFFGCGALLQGQSGSGRIQGTVRDASGAIVPRATVTVTATATNTATNLVTNDAGIYATPALTPGNYQISVQSEGFNKWEGHLVLRVAQTAVVNATLTIAGISQQITVAGDVTPLVNTANQTIGSTLDRQRIEDLPENGRSVSNLVQLTTPGVVGGRVNGMNSAAFEYVQDGAVLANEDFGGANYKLPDPESIQEVKVETSNSSAKFNRPATAILTTKAGTNHFHGTLFETMRNNSFGVARRREDPVGVKAPELIRNEFGGSIGGPIYLPYIDRHGPKLYNGKDRSFFFVAYEGLELRQSVTKDFAVPTDAMRGGDFSALTDANGNPVTIYDPLTTADDPQATRQPFPNNQIPMSRLSPLAQKIFAIMPHPTLPNVNPSISHNWYGPTPNNDSEKSLTIRLDQHFSDSNTAYIRYTHGKVYKYALGSGNYGPPAIGNIANVTYQPTYTDSGSLSWTHVFSPTFFSETVLSHDYESDRVSTGPNPNVDYADQFGIPNNFHKNGFPNITGIGFLPYGFGQADTSRENSQYISNLDENLTLIRGRHTLQFGGRYRHERVWILPDQNPPASSVTFSSIATGELDPSTGAAESAAPRTGNAAASFFLGYAATYTATKSQQWYRFRNQEIAFYFQDDFKVNSKLTLNLGVRWEIHPALHEKYGLFGGYDFKTGAIVLGKPLDYLYKIGETTPAIVSNFTDVGATFETPEQAGLPPSLVYGNYHDIAPRLGAAYELFGGNHPTVLRGGYGTYVYAPPVRNFYAETRFNPPYTAGFSKSYTSAAQSPDGLPNYLLRSVPTVVAGLNSSNVVNSDSPGLVTPGSFGPSALDPHYPSTFVQQWNFTIEQGLPKNTVLRASYIGNHGSNLEQYWEYDDAPNSYVWYVRTGEPLPTGKYANVLTRPYPNLPYGEIEVQRKTGYSNDNSLQLELQRLQKNGYGFQVFYVLSNAFRMGGNGWRDNIYEPASYFAPGAVPSDVDASNRFQNYMRDTAIPQHQIRWNWLVDIPVGKGKRFLGSSNRLVDAIVGGWRLGSTGELESQFWQPTTSYYQPTKLHVYGKKYKVNDCRSGQCRPGYLWYNGYIPANKINVANGVEGVPHDYTPFNTPLIQTPANGGSKSDPNYPYYESNSIVVPLNNGKTVRTTYNPGINPLLHTYELGPFNWTMDASIFKAVKITEGTAVQFNADFFNVLNEPGLKNPNTTSGIIDTGYSYNAPRQLQLTLRLLF